jgi:hypothetical protein
MAYEADDQTFPHYDVAMERFRAEPALAPYEDIIFNDWPEGDEHHQWVAEAPLAELLDWARTLAKDSPEMVRRA